MQVMVYDMEGAGFLSAAFDHVLCASPQLHIDVTIALSSTIAHNYSWGLL